MALSVQPLNNPNSLQGYGPGEPYGAFAAPAPAPADSGGGGGYYDSGGGGSGGGGGGGYSSGGGGGGGYAAPAPVWHPDPNVVGQYDQGIGNTQAAINRTGSQMDSGYSEIEASYQNALNQLLTGENQAKATYNNDKDTTAHNYVGSKNTIRGNAGASLNSLLRLLGMHGAGGGSAYRITAPGAVATTASKQQTDVGNTFAANNRSLDTNWGNYETGVNNQRASAVDQSHQQQAALTRQIANNKATLLQQLAQLQAQKASYTGGNPNAASQPYLNQANQILDATSRYSVAPISWQTQAYTVPTLDKYTVNPNASPTYQGAAPTNDYTSPYLAALLGKNQKQEAFA
jgi:hypothetical protein